VGLKSAIIAMLGAALIALASTFILVLLFAYPGGEIMWEGFFLAIFLLLSIVIYVQLEVRREKCSGTFFGGGAT
jgi:hypothetical protein